MAILDKWTETKNTRFKLYERVHDTAYVRSIDRAGGTRVWAWNIKHPRQGTWMTESVGQSLGSGIEAAEAFLAFLNKEADQGKQ